MPQSKQAKYTAAVERNIAGAAKNRFEDLNLAETKTALGIRKEDSSYDNRIKAMFKMKE